MAAASKTYSHTSAQPIIPQHKEYNVHFPTYSLLHVEIAVRFCAEVRLIELVNADEAIFPSGCVHRTRRMDCDPIRVISTRQQRDTDDRLP